MEPFRAGLSTHSFVNATLRYIELVELRPQFYCKTYLYEALFALFVCVFVILCLPVPWLFIIWDCILENDTLDLEQTPVRQRDPQQNLRTQWMVEFLTEELRAGQRTLEKLKHESETK